VELELAETAERLKKPGSGTESDVTVGFTQGLV